MSHDLATKPAYTGRNRGPRTSTPRYRSTSSTNAQGRARWAAIRYREQLKTQAFTANRLAKASGGAAREAFYRIKDAAINALLIAGWGFVDRDSVKWREPDPTMGVLFVGGGGLHTKLSALSLSAFRIVRLQLNTD